LGRANNNMFLGRDIASERDFSEETAAVIDQEVNLLVENAYKVARAVLIQNRLILDKIADMLVERETVDASELQEILLENNAQLAIVS